MQRSLIKVSPPTTPPRSSSPTQIRIFLVFLRKEREGETLEYTVLNRILPSTATPSGLREPCRREGRKRVRARGDADIKKTRPSRDSKHDIYVNSEMTEACTGRAQDVHRTCSGLSQMEPQDWDCRWAQVPICILRAVSNWPPLTHEKLVLFNGTSLGIQATFKVRPHAKQ